MTSAKRKRKSTSLGYKPDPSLLRIGIDPGVRAESPGGIVAIQGKHWLESISMPSAMFGNSSMAFVDGLSVLRFIERHQPDEIVIELVGARPEQGVSSTFKFGAAFGAVVGVALASEYPVTLVHPSVWKRRAGLIGTTKDAARQMALGLFPGAAAHLKRKKDIGKADASLIAMYGGL